MDDTVNKRLKRIDTSAMVNSWDALQQLCHDIAVEKGWWEKPATIGESIALMHSELSEALEEYRNGHTPDEVYFVHDKPEGLPVELMDCLIRIFDFAGYYKIETFNTLLLKIVYNASRPHKHGGKVI